LVERAFFRFQKPNWRLYCVSLSNRGTISIPNHQFLETADGDGGSLTKRRTCSSVP
jgi:hypothetical protein